MTIRVDAARALIEGASPDEHFVVWHDLEDERRSLKKAMPEIVELYGSQDIDLREKLTLDFCRGKIRLLATKPMISGSGTNFQHHCHRAIYLGVGYKFRDFIQSIHRLQRFGQTRTVRIDIIHTDAEDAVVQTLQRKWAQHKELTTRMRAIIKQYGLTNEALVSGLQRNLGVTRCEVVGALYTAVNNDTVIEMTRLADESVGEIVTSIPFGNHYEYVASYNDFGHNPTDGDFWRQMDFLIPNLHRVLKPGRIAAIHVKDRLLYSHQTSHGMMEVDPFSDDTVRAFRKHGFVFYGRVTIPTDVVRENSSTNRLGWTENSKDGSKMGVGMPEYVLLFRKPQTDKSRSYADEPVRKDKTVYTRARWQIDAHQLWRSDGKTLTPWEDPDVCSRMDSGALYRWYVGESPSRPYDYEQHVAFNEAVGESLPATFSVLPAQAPPEYEEFVWTDILFMRTLNMQNARRRIEKHVCPLPIDIVKRLIVRYSNPGDMILDPFAGLFTVPYVAIGMGRTAYGVELNPTYHEAGVHYCNDAENRASTSTLFDLADVSDNEDADIEWAIGR
jgi:DNA modification methylase